MRRVLPVALLLCYSTLAAGADPIAAPQYERYYRSVRSDSASGQACAVMDAHIFANAAPSIRDLRLYQDNREVPYAVTLSEAAQPDTESARVLNLGRRNGSVVFDIEMPPRPYTDVNLDIPAMNFIATAKVSGSNAERSEGATELGEYTLFDLTRQHLSRSTALHLQESNLRYLHVVLTVSPAPGGSLDRNATFVRGASVPPSREAQTLFTIAAETATITKRGKQTVATFALPTRVPVERVSFELAPDSKGNFSRDVKVFDRPEGSPAYAGEAANGTILRVHLSEAGREIKQQQLSVPVTIGSNLQGPASVEVVIDNGDDPPLPVTAVRLEMRQRKLCFDTAKAPSPVLFYGDPALQAPQYDYARLFTQMSTTQTAMMGPPQLNPVYKPRQDTRPLTERRPETLWIALLAVISLLSLVAFRSTKMLPR